MPSAGVMAVAALLAIGFLGVRGVVVGVKKASHQVVCLVNTGHKCPPKNVIPKP